MLRLGGALRQAGKALTEDALQAEWHSVEAVRVKAERDLLAPLLAMFDAQRREVLDRLPEVLAGIGSTKRHIDTSLIQGLLEQAVWDGVIRNLLEEELPGIAEEGFLTGVLRVALPGDPSLEMTPRLRSIIDAVLDKTQSVNATTLDELGRAIGDGLEAGETLEQITERVRGVFGAIEDWRAQTIAETAALPAFEIGQQEAYLAAGLTRHGWLSQRDGAVRVSHQRTDGEVVEIGEAFSNGLLFPGDPLGPPREVIRCRCTTRPILSSKGDVASPMFARKQAMWHRLWSVKAKRYASTQFNIEGEERTLALSMAASIRDEDLAGDGRESDPHVTVRFGITDLDVETTRQVVEDFGPVTLAFGAISLFKGEVAEPSFGYDVVKVDVEGERLRELNQLIRNEVPGEDTHPTYVPHLTLAYVEAGRGWMYLAMENPLDGRSVEVNELVFSVPDGDIADGSISYRQVNIDLGSDVSEGDIGDDTSPELPEPAMSKLAHEATFSLEMLNDRERGRMELALRDYMIRQDHAAGEKNLSVLAEKYHCSESTARRAIWGS